MKKLMVLGLLAAASWSAQANLCEKNKITQRHRDEAVLVKSEAFAPASPNYQGEDEYNAWVLACNRNRDNKGKEIDAAISPKNGGKFAQNLPMKSVKGQYSFYGNSVGANVFTSLEYRYALRRESGEWIVTLPIELNIPEVVAYNTNIKNESMGPALQNRLDIPKWLAVNLGLMTATGSGTLVCDPGQEVMTTYLRSGVRVPLVDTGYHNPSDSYDGPACRLKPTHPASGYRDVLAAYHDFWKGTIEQAWNRPGFKVEPLMIGHDAIGDGFLKILKKDDLIWKLNMTFDASQRPRYRSAVLSLPHIYVGAYPDTIAHEAGHELGLDDEYREDDKGDKNAWRDCSDDKLVPNGKSYIMCWAGYVGTSDSASYWSSPFGIVAPSAAKGVYPWIITRRYAVAKDMKCYANADCASNQYCDTGTAGIGRNQCVAKRSENEQCSADDQCRQPAICKGKPLGKCITESSVGMGGTCSRDAQCTTGSCDNNGICQCKQNSHCGSDEYCDTGSLGVGRNRCVALKSENAACSANDQCQSPAICKGAPAGKCITEASVGLGGSCSKDAQCTTGSCSSKGQCQCKSNADCASNQYCDTGTLSFGGNQCVAKRAENASCSADDQCTSPAICKGKPAGKCITEASVPLGGSCTKDAQCVSDSCSSKGHCQCKKDSLCPSGQVCKEPVFGENYCKKK